MQVSGILQRNIFITEFGLLGHELNPRNDHRHRKSENRGTVMDIDTNFLAKRGMDTDMVTACNRCPPNSALRITLRILQHFYYFFGLVQFLELIEFI